MWFRIRRPEAEEPAASRPDCSAGVLHKREAQNTGEPQKPAKRPVWRNGVRNDSEQRQIRSTRCFGPWWGLWKFVSHVTGSHRKLPSSGQQHDLMGKKLKSSIWQQGLGERAKLWASCQSSMNEEGWRRWAGESKGGKQGDVTERREPGPSKLRGYGMSMKNSLGTLSRGLQSGHDKWIWNDYKIMFV